MAIINNNPGNIRCVPSNNWQGQTGCSPSGFCIFSSMYYGLRAMMKIIINDILAGTNTIHGIISQYAPPNENNTTAYIQNVSNWSGVGIYEVIDEPDQLYAVMAAMIRMETSEAVDPDLFPVVYDNLYNTMPTDPVPVNTNLLWLAAAAGVVIYFHNE